jgi:hypothetical protein
MENNPLLAEQSVKPSSNSFSENLNTGKKSKQLYVLNLDGSRIFWILSIVLLLMTFVLLLGYWIGSDASTSTPVSAAQRTASAAIRENISPSSVAAENRSGVRITEERTAASQTPDASAGNGVPQSENTSRTSSAAPNPSVTEERILDTENAGRRENGSNTPVASTRRRIARNLGFLRRRRGIDTSGSDKYMTRSKPYAIQIATHTSYRTASAVRKSLRKKRFPAYIFLHKTASGKKFYKIRVGTFSSRSLAMKYIEKVKKISLGRRSIIVHR